MTAEQILDRWLRSAPEWARAAYLNDPTVNRVMKQCAHAGDGTHDMLWRLAGALYERGNSWEATALHAAESSSRPIFPTP